MDALWLTAAKAAVAAILEAIRGWLFPKKAPPDVAREEARKFAEPDGSADDIIGRL
jgi:hypothetical protein